MKLKGLGHLERHSLLLILASLVGHVGNYAYHFITGRLLPEVEYGLLMALFGAVHIVLFPLSALQLSLTRAIAELKSEGNQGEIAGLLRSWVVRLTGASVIGFGFVLALHPLLFELFGVDRWAPLLLAAAIPCIALFLTLTGAGLQGLQLFRGLALRGALLFSARAILVGGCLVLGFAAAGWALLAHVLAMLLALGISGWLLVSNLPPSTSSASDVKILPGTLRAFPLLLAFSVLMSADVILVRAFHPDALSGSYAQAATLGRMILWIPLPIAQALFPKVVGRLPATGSHQPLLVKALLYTSGLVLFALAGAWVLGPFIFELLFGNAPSIEQIGWLRGIGVSMAFLGPVYVVMHYEMAQHRHAHLIPICLFALVYVGSAWFLGPTPDQLIRFLGVAAAFSLLTVVRGLGAERVAPSAP